jgi:flagellar basal-body rod protein FlgG
MNGAFYIGAVGLDAQQQALNVVANNIANVNTTAFKRQMVQFSELVNAAHNSGDGDPAQNLAATGAISGAGVAVNTAPRDWSQGPLTQTGHPLDLAIQGDGFLEVMGPSGSNLLWRGGTLEVNADGYLATSDGNTLRAMISVPQGAQNLAIMPAGAVMAQISATGQTRQIGQLDIALAKDPASLADQGGGYFEAFDNSEVLSVKPGEEGGGTFVQGSLETSNVQLSNEMVNLLLVQRAYGANAEVVQAGDQLMSIANNLRR